ncbi:fatty acyl-AMP ligase [Saccharomonospora piscinae]|uniref:fatty acyl-AMP ligase n=1 Tax=Saccharomonospora piscinae TaxID=687388 RepID=UPI000464907A|nr:fatty acyl-AMP ligase [Saccharomonospora piscinae]
MSQWAKIHSDQPAVIFVRNPNSDESIDSLTYLQLHEKACQVAALLSRSHPRGSRVLLLYPQGVEFVAGFLGCLYAGMVAVPAPLPTGREQEDRRIGGIAADSGAVAVLTSSIGVEPVRRWMRAAGSPRLELVASDDPELLSLGREPASEPIDPIDPDSLAVLQYTSGSTNEPKGVMVSHRAMVTNVANHVSAFSLSAGMRTGGWLPLYHDMGLLATLAPALFLGSACVLLDVHTFLKRPVSWLRLIDRFDIAYSAAPNFAYEMCCKRISDDELSTLDLSRWRCAVSGSEPIHAETMRQFAHRFAEAGLGADALRPAYGLAEAVVFVSAATGLRTEPVGGDREVVGCGPVEGLEAQVVDPVTMAPRPDGETGELLLRGSSVCAGYWRNEAATHRTFRAGVPGHGSGWLRTGDLAAVRDGQLFLVGRIKETLIVHGRNVHPHDLEHEVRLHHPELGHVGAAFAVSAGGGAEQVIITHEVSASVTPERMQSLTVAMRRTVARELGVAVGGIGLLPKGSVRRTTSGKIRRLSMRELFCDGRLEHVYLDRGAQASFGARPGKVSVP